ncbi:urea ABC transporter ATP-binding subunit UrtE [Cohnella zeiphila]|uniref:Urea ABC transporter ATP-binding subunit UrtE n=1 Tax=Cohnella zeiphila TaxID=2761120 RepID=A0A7X0VU49_9BACL|nr:urea ABC transporter ATP-binding subunit UrtE [Cohnella zeiphila]MBB6729877.1 urea ABC transporter ATP-binding subunit UrtE [Cohnella zeiphila]
MLSVRRLESGYGESVVVRDVSLEVRPGQVVCLMGRNGVGKTTLLKTIMGALKARGGSIRFGEAELTRKAPGARAAAGIGYVPQGREIFPQLSVYENLLLGLEAGRESRKRGIPEAALEKFPVLRTMYRRKGGDLSGGQQQQLAFARALAAEPKLLLLDEPTEGIQPSIVQEIRDVIVNIKQDGSTAILLVEQSLEFVRSVADYVYVIDKGTVVAAGAFEELDESELHRHLAV